MNLGMGRDLSSSQLEVAGGPSLVGRGFHEGVPHGTSPQPDCRRRKRKSYFQCFTFDFFSIAVMKPGLLLKQYHPKSSRVGAPGNSNPLATIPVTVGMRPFRLSTDLPGLNDASEEDELIDALSEDELLEECLEEDPDEPIQEEALEVVEATSASRLD
ncbi:LOW QUALITY PROTEIN: hypothetical protein Cgig2_005973 [Carnegiea gigantea]|uniref:Uncharacterized protein n=1 Tax=Carnegiea gigantea TaxID=171969 RepID=A0A9Q1QK21_9CARY|nr:LOW QUALITY PROTEIN: hypothetical protein Cgig2_005973 [Carnegiea gigantea]